MNSFKIDSILVIIPAASLSKGGTNPACKNIVQDITHDIRHDIGYDISISNIQYDIIYDIGYDIGISVYITYLDCCMHRNAWCQAGGEGPGAGNRSASKALSNSSWVISL